tara:strand:- start:116 stop:259 length:144 start_codon:yes stop_codon:yes gene_type:complete
MVIIIIGQAVAVVQLRQVVVLLVMVELEVEAQVVLIQATEDLAVVHL